MPSTQEYKKLGYPGIFGMFQGTPSSRKSTAALSFPKPYVMDFDCKMPGVALKHFPDKDIHWDPQTDIIKAGERLESWWTNGCPYETIIVDSITACSTASLNTVGRLKQESVLKMLKNVKDNKTNSGKSIEMMSFDYYNGETNFMNRYLTPMLQELYNRPGPPYHVIFLAHLLVKEVTDIKGNTTKTTSIVTAGQKVGIILPSVFNETYEFKPRKGALQGGGEPMYESICYTGPHEDVLNRTNYPFPYEINFTKKPFYDTLLEHVGQFQEFGPEPETRAITSGGLIAR